jgi:acetylornithine deacetylase/succinyl-diaminopimelate desuccinylase-like protein
MPFAGTIAKNRIWGRGALDDKSGVIGLMEAAYILNSK